MKNNASIERPCRIDTLSTQLLNWLGQDRSGQFMSGHVRTEYSLPKSFGSEHFWDPKYFGSPKNSLIQNFWTQIDFGIENF